MHSKGLNKKNKNFGKTQDCYSQGPMIRLNVPDFKQINNYYEQLQQQAIDKPDQARKKGTKMKSFSIRKSNQPDPLVEGYELDDKGNDLSDPADEEGQPEQPSQLTAEEEEMLKPKELKVVNPWIHEATHKEYLEQVKGLPARHANVIKKHLNVQREKTFIHELEQTTTDAQANEGLKLLESEYEIFSDPNLPSTKALTRFDTWDEEWTIKEWLDYCHDRPMEAHALSPVFEGNDYVWKPVRVIDYDYTNRKWKVVVSHTNQVKFVTRLSLLFLREDPELFKKRVNMCKKMQAIVEAEQRFTALVDSIPAEKVSILSKERRYNFLSKCIREKDKFEADQVYNMFKHLMKIVEEEYCRQMKKCIILKDMMDPHSHQIYLQKKIPIRISRRTAPYYGVVMMPTKFPFNQVLEDIMRQHWSSDGNLVSMTKKFSAKCIDFQVNRYMNTDKMALKLPRELDDLIKIQNSHHAACKQNMQIQWREYLVSDIQEELKNSNHNFYEGNRENYEKGPLKRIITRFELIMNTHLREFVKLSIDDWVKFLKDFTLPNPEQLWPIQKAPMIVIHIHMTKPHKKKTKEKKEKGDSPAKVEEQKIDFQPTLEKCQSFFQKAFNDMIESTNAVCILENDLMSFLETEEKPNFELDINYPWFKEALVQVNNIISENMKAPLELLDKFKQFEELAKSSKTKIKKELFDGEHKATIEELRAKLKKYDDDYYTIMNLSNDIVDFPIFRVMTGKMKKELGDKALSIRNYILQAISDFCSKTVEEIHKTYQMMYDKIGTDPQDEKQLVEIRDFIKDAPRMEADLEAKQLDVKKHLAILEDYCFYHDDKQIQSFWLLLRWHLEILAQTSEGNSNIQNKENIFSQRLEQDREKFKESIGQFQAQLEKIKEFTDLSKNKQYSQAAGELKEQLNKANEDIAHFNEREKLFNLQETEYPEFKSMQDEFEMFYDLALIAYDAMTYTNEWTEGSFIKLTPHEIEKSVQEWLQKCHVLNKKLAEDYPDNAAVAVQLRQEIDTFAQQLPLIRNLRSEAILDEDWEEIKQIVGKPELERNEELKLSQMVQWNFMQFIEEIEEVAMRAQKKHSLKQKLTQMREEMKDFKVDQFPHKSATYVLKGYDEINAKLDDQIVQVQAMLGSAYMKGKLRIESKAWEKKLNDISELIEAIGKTQRGWMYLEPIFASEDIHKQMPTEGNNFKAVDALWRQTMDLVVADAGIMALADQENIKNQFDEANKKLDDIQKQLNDYLEEKRQVFPRFYFLANDDLLMILAQTKEPKAVQPHMDKCFEGIQSLMFSDKEEVYGMVSAEDERVEYDKKIDVNEGEKKGNVEKWLLDVEAQMRKTLQRICKDSLQAYGNTKRTEWVLNWPGQVILAVNQIDWTIGVENAISNTTLSEYEKLLNDQIEDIVQLVRTDLTAQNRMTLKAMVVIDVHARDVVSELIHKKVSSVYEFDWMAQLRYYWEEKDLLRVKMVTSIIDYGYEYLGNSPRLVITPLTDRCYRTLMGAKYLNYGGAPEGPAGTGKTESVKDLAKALAVQCVVFNCSDGLDYLAMAKFFKGLASSGAWCCFDEFNRIDLEVLSVIAQQILTIQLAIANLKQRNFVFEGTEIKINRACAVNITMNPGYAGRSELPDNLKALFRPCAMMVPDYKLIAEIELYSFGFSNASSIAVKVVASLRLSSEQLSSQDHYDFGMRALKAILTACGNLRRKLDMEEDLIAMRALYDVNLPKFTSNDIPLFRGITSDLFPGKELPKPDYGALMDGLIEACSFFNLSAKPEFLKKCIELFETIMVRHGLMLVGYSYSGKSRVMKCLQRAMSQIKDDPNFQNVLTYFINPKSILQDQLYGRFDPDTHEWTDGVLAIKIRNCAEAITPDRKWIVFDGPVDAVWIENMNTVLDDNKKLCLNSGQIIKLKPTMTIMFEVEDLQAASPATVSRCGMVFLEPKQLGHSVLITSYCKDVSEYFFKGNHEKFEAQLHQLADASMAWMQKCVSKLPTPLDAAYIVNSMLNIFDSFLTDFRGEDVKLPQEFEQMVPNFIFFALIWSVGGALDEHYRPKFNEFVQELINGDDVREKYDLDDLETWEPKKLNIKLPDFKSVFDIFFDKQNLVWLNWIKTIPAYQVPKDAEYTSLIIPTVDNIRIAKLMSLVALNSKHILFVGPTGTGKTISIVQELKNFSPDEYSNLSLSFSAQTSANQTQRIIDGKMDKRRKGVYGPPQSKQGIIYVDDLNMPQKETYGAQPPIELLRQWMDYGGWYDIDTKEKDFREIQSIRFVAAMGPPGGGRTFITQRYVRHFSVVYVEPYSNDSLKYIFSNIMDWFLLQPTIPAFPKSMQALRDSLVSCTILMYEKVCTQFRPTPAKSHYTYNLRDVSKVFQGVAKGSPKGIRNDSEMIKLWAHECMRVFKDRLINQQDRDDFDESLKALVKDKFKREWDKLVEVNPLLFASFVPLVYPDGDESKRPFVDLYCELTDREKLVKQCQQGLEDFNHTNHQKKMNLVLFMDAIEHVVKIHRIITTSYGNALLVGVGGSGRKSLTELATSIAVFETMQIEIVKGYGINEWRDDMRNIMQNCGVEFKDTIFLFSDTQIVNETFVEDVNNILNNGEIPNLFSAAEDVQNVLDGIKDSTKGQSNVKNFQDSDYFAYFIERCKQKLHVVLTFSPIGEAFKRRLRMFPSLVNCTTIDWFLPWPKDALQSVASYFLDQIEDLDNKEGIVEVFVDMQQRVTELTHRYLSELRRYYYVTPTSYLELIKSFKNLLGRKEKEINTIINKYTKGLKQLNDAAEQVAVLQEELKELEPKLKIADEETTEMIKNVEEQKKEVEIISKDVAKEEASASEKTQEAQAIEKDCQEALNKVRPIYEKAVSAVKDLNKGDIVELRGISKPSDGVKLVIQSLCIIFSIKPNKVKGQTAKEGTILDYWTPAQKQLLTPNLLKQCLDYDKDNVKEEIVKEITPLLESPDYSDKVLEKASKAAFGMAKWVRAIIQYDEAMKIVRPKEQQLKEAKAASKEAQDLWDAAIAKLKAVQERMQNLIQQKDECQARKEKLAKDTKDCKEKKVRAENLIIKLGDEKINWEKSLEKNLEFKKHLVGDVVISSGIIAYLGVFTQTFRTDCINTWTTLMHERNIISSETVKLEYILGDQIQIRNWQLKELPQDSFSVDNAIIMNNSDRWPLMIDPQMQANNWIKKSEEESNLTIIKPTTDSQIVSRNLESCMRLGYPVLLEDATETIDPLLEPVLAKNIVTKGGMMQIKFGDSLIDYDKNFKFYVTTKLSRPHYAPEICVKVVMLNFMVTEEGLEDQMLQVTVRLEDKKSYDKRINCISQKAANEQRLTELQDKILTEIANATGNLLENEELYNTLDESKQACIQIDEELEQMKKTLEQVEKRRNEYKDVARRVSNLFFCISDLSNVDPMYQYSLRWFSDLYEKSINDLGKLPEKPTLEEKKSRTGDIIRAFTQLLYQNICRSLFEKDKLLFSLLLCMKIMEEHGELNQLEARFLMTGGSWADSKKPNPTGDNGWLLPKPWLMFQEMCECLPAFKGLSEDVTKYIGEWEAIYNSQRPHRPDKEPWPAKWGEISHFKRLLILRALRPDKIVPAIQIMVSEHKELGKFFIEPPSFDLAASFADSNNKSPIIFILSPGADPMSELKKVADQQRKKWDSLSLGQGQGPKAIEAIKTAQETHTWVVLQNCHLAPSFMPTLDAILEKIEKDPNSEFRMWLTSMPSDRFPVSILQNGVKVTNEPPKGLRNNILGAFVAQNADDFESCNKQKEYKKLMFGLCFFNALILERRKYGPLGWNIPYEFSASDLRISQSQLMMFLNAYDEIPWEALQYMVAEANYGGRVTDPKDRRCINVILMDFYTPEILKDGHKLSKSGKYYAPNGSLDDYIEYIREQMPLNDMTEIFGLHDNADITAAINDTNALLDTVLSLMPRSTSGTGKSQDEILQEKATELLHKIPTAFDLLNASKKHPIKYEESMNTVLQQELLRFNKLINRVRSSLVNLGKAIKGEVVMSADLEQVANAMFDNQVPAVWSQVSYPSLKPLGSWINDFVKRLEFMQDWIDNGAPASFWISGFFFTQSFLTGTKQNYSRKYQYPIDKVDFDYEVINDTTKTDVTVNPPDGSYIHGLFLEGCRWDTDGGYLAESHPRVLYTSVPTVWMKPSKVDEIPKKHSYTCPIYKQSQRRGTLSTTGHSTNFVLDMELLMQEQHDENHWIKRGVAMLTQLND